MVETFEELQMVLRCCERLVTELGPGLPPDPVVVEGVWTMALLSYARCFAQRGTAAALGEDELTTVQPESDVLEWHKVLLQLREHYGDPTNSPRERFTVAVTQDADGAASGVAITSVKQPLVDEVTVRQLGRDRLRAQQPRQRPHRGPAAARLRRARDRVPGRPREARPARRRAA